LLRKNAKRRFFCLIVVMLQSYLCRWLRRWRSGAAYKRTEGDCT